MDILVAIDALDDLLHNGSGGFMLWGTRVDPEKLASAVASIHATLPPETRRRAESSGLLERLDVLAGAARPLRVGRKVGVDADALYDVLDELRRTVGEARGT